MEGDRIHHVEANKPLSKGNEMQNTKLQCLGNTDSKSRLTSCRQMDLFQFTALMSHSITEGYGYGVCHRNRNRCSGLNQNSPHLSPCPYGLFRKD